MERGPATSGDQPPMVPWLPAPATAGQEVIMGQLMFTVTLLPGHGDTARIFVPIKMLSSAQSERIPTVMCHPLCIMYPLNADLNMEK